MTDFLHSVAASARVVDGPARSRVPLAPVLTYTLWNDTRATRLPSVLDAGPARLVTSGRVAIAMALREMGLGPGDAMLVPAWHTLSMITPLAWVGVEAVFYDVGPDGRVDPAELERRRTPAVRALMATHYFGFHQDMAALRGWCDATGLSLLEDCAHCFFGAIQHRPAGSWGDYAIASSMKFYPTYEGGCLVSARHVLHAPAPHSAGVRFEVKAALAAMERAFAHGRLPLLRVLLTLPLRVKNVLWSHVKRIGMASAGVSESTPASSDSSVRFEPEWIDRRSALFSRAVLHLANANHIVSARRANYRRLEEALAGLPGCRPLHPALPDDVCPWVFPLLCDAPELLFTRLQVCGVPVVRFAEARDPAATAGDFPHSTLLTRGVLGFPLHQTLREDEMDWLCSAIRKAACA